MKGMFSLIADAFLSGTAMDTFRTSVFNSGSGGFNPGEIKKARKRSAKKRKRNKR